jgi:threonyl-tRNA synthetase
MALSTRPEKFLGEVSLWDLAEAVRYFLDLVVLDYIYIF